MLTNKLQEISQEDEAILKGIEKLSVSETSIAQEFEHIVTKFPHCIALISNDKSYTYKQLNNKVNICVSTFLKSGIRPNNIVGLHSNSRASAIISILSLQKIGAAYVPLNPSSHIDLKRKIIRVLGVNKILSEDIHLIKDKVSDITEVIDITLANTEEQSDHASCYHSAENVNAESPSYTIFTSGSTGEPKGISIKHKSVLNMIESAREIMQIKAGVRVLQFASLTFDASIWEIFTTLLSGGTLVLAQNSILSNTESFVGFLTENRINVITLPPSFLAILPKSSMPFLETIVVAGERCPSSVAQKWCSEYRLVNAYGLSECSVCSSFHIIKNSCEHKIIGRPLTNTNYYVLNKQMEPVYPGQEGTLFISGVGVADGYLNNRKLSSKKFIKDKFFPKKMLQMYNTGDIVRYTNDRNIEYVGREDEQIKIRGYRIELGSIEAHIQNHPAIQQAAVKVHVGKNHEKYIIAYYSFIKGSVVKVQDIRKYLKRYLPVYMVPSFFVAMNRVPVTAHGKIDRKKLTFSPLRSQVSSSLNKYVPKNISNLKESQIIDLFYRLLPDVKSIFAHDDFFNLGGNSLLALRLLSELVDKFNITLTINDLFECRTAERLALKLSDVQKDSNQLIVKLNYIDVHKEPLFVLPPIGGTCFSYLPLATQLNTQRAIYGIQDPAINKLNIKVDSIEELSGFYIQQIKKIQPHGPYNLAGSSFGATIVVEITKQLEEQGEQVNCAALIDGFSDFSLAKQRFAKDKSNYLSELQRLMPGDMTAESPYFDMMCHRLEMLLKYQLPKINTPLVLFKAKTVLPKFKALSSPDNGWSKYSPAVKLYEIPGDHETILAEPNVGSLAKILARYIDGVERSHLNQYKKMA